MPYAFKLPRRTEQGYDLLVTDGSEQFWRLSDTADEATIVSWGEPMNDRMLSVDDEAVERWAQRLDDTDDEEYLSTEEVRERLGL